MLKNKKGLTTSIIQTSILSLVLLVVLFQIYANITPEAQAAGNNLGNQARCESAGGNFATGSCTTNGSIEGAAVGFDTIPLSGLFSGTGVVFIIIIAALIILVVKSFMTGDR